MGQLERRNNRERFYAILLAGFVICSYNGKQTKPDFSSHGKAREKWKNIRKGIKGR